MNKEAIIRKMFDDLVKFNDSELFLKEIDIL